LAGKFKSKADEEAYWAQLERERVAHDPKLSFERYHSSAVPPEAMWAEH